MTVRSTFARSAGSVAALLAVRAAVALAGPYELLQLPAGVEPTLRSAPVGAIHAGSLSIHLEKTPLARLQKAFGGTLQQGGDAGNSAQWLCLRARDGTQWVAFWFISNSEMGGPEHAVTQVALQRLAGPPPGCSEAPAGFSVDLRVPGLGASRQAIARQFGAAAPGTDAGYASSTAVHGLPGATRLQSVQYRLVDGVVVTVSVAQVTSH